MMNFRSRVVTLTKSRRGKGVALGVLLLCLAGHIAMQTRQHSAAAAAASNWWKSIPPQGRSLNDTNGTVPGNPDNGVKGLKAIYSMIQVYHQRTGGHPSTMVDLILDIRKEPGAYGFNSFEDADKVFGNPDDRLSDSMVGAKTTYVCLYLVTNKRPDGTTIGGPKHSGERDILASTDTYFHENVRYFKGQRSTVNPVGFHLVLWDDGQVEKIPYDHLLYVPLAQGGFGEAFLGQAGVPSNALTYDQFYKLTGWKNGGPRGSVGGKGQSYNGKTHP